jgi:PadR family transcriptional regulator PadR
MENNPAQKFGALRKGLLEFVTAKIIAGRAVYAADILARLAETDFATGEGTLYPLLSKMRREGLVEYEWRESESGPPRKYYRLTAKGRAALAETERYWSTLVSAIKNLSA